MILAAVTACQDRREGEGRVKLPENPFLGQKRPGKKPVLFAPGIVSTSNDELNATFTPDGREFYYSARQKNKTYAIYRVALDKGEWSTPQIAPFSGRFTDADPFVTPDGLRMFFISKRPVEGFGPPYDIWIMDRIEGGWGEPYDPGAPVNSPVNEGSPAVTSDGTLYFVSKRYGGYGYRDIYFSRQVEGGYPRMENPGGSISTEYDEGGVFISPDESYMIFVSVNRPDGFGSGDLYIAFRDTSGVWSDARNLGEDFNSPHYDHSPSVSPDGGYFFFTRQGNIYWADISALDALRPENE